MVGLLFICVTYQRQISGAALPVRVALRGKAGAGLPIPIPVRKWTKNLIVTPIDTDTLQIVYR